METLKPYDSPPPANDDVYDPVNGDADLYHIDSDDRNADWIKNARRHPDDPHDISADGTPIYPRVR